jgi:hypothetical protein
MLSKKYLNSVKNLSAIIRKIVELPAPEKFTIEFLKNSGFPDTNDRAVIGLLKDLHFLTDGAIPSQRYHHFKDSGGAGYILGEAVREAYGDIFMLNSNPSPVRSAMVRELFKNTHQVSDQLAGFMSNTFFTLYDLAENMGSSIPVEPIKLKKEFKGNGKFKKELPGFSLAPENMRYHIEIHLPLSRDIEIYNSIFKSLKDNLLND